MSLPTSCIAVDILSIEEIKAISTKKYEQAVLVFGSGSNKLKVLCGDNCQETWAIMPPLNVLIQWLSQTKICFQEAIVVHNHPQVPWHGEIIPSDNDIVSTEFLKWQLALLGITLTDHTIISGDKKQSLAEINLYRHNSPLKVSGFEIKRFIYCFLVQASVVVETTGSVLEELIDALEKNLDRIRPYYENSHCCRIFKTKPVDDKFTKKLLTLGTSDPVINKLINFFIDLDDGKRFKIKPDKVIPYGLELQKKFISATYKLR